jgi:hypothetical protein
MNRLAAKTMRWRFLVGLGHNIHVTWPVLSAILGTQLALGLLTGFVEGGLSRMRSISLSLPVSRLVTVISSRGKRWRAYLRLELVSAGSFSRVS